MSYQDDNYRDDPAGSRSEPDRDDDRYQADRDRDDRKRTSAPGQPPATGCSKGCLYGMAGCGCLTLMGVVALVVVGWQFAQVVIKGTSTDPAVIRTATLEMAEITPPVGLEPKLKMDVVLAKVIFYQSNDGKSTLSLLQISPQFAQQEPGKNREFGDGFRRGFGNGGQDLKQQELTIEKSEVQDVMIRGQISKVKFSAAKNPEGADYRIIDGEFQGKAGLVELQLQLPLEKYDEAEVKKFLESIK